MIATERPSDLLEQLKDAPRDLVKRFASRSCDDPVESLCEVTRSVADEFARQSKCKPINSLLVEGLSSAMAVCCQTIYMGVRFRRSILNDAGPALEAQSHAINTFDQLTAHLQASGAIDMNRLAKMRSWADDNRTNLIEKRDEAQTWRDLSKSNDLGHNN